jgi:hypothetical protein
MRGGFREMKRPAALLAGVLLLLPFLLIAYRIFWLKYPFFPPAPGKAWQVSMEARLDQADEETAIKIGLPSEAGEWIVTDEQIHSGSLLFNLLREGPNKVGVWSGIPAADGEYISYRATILIDSRNSPAVKPPGPGSYPETFGDEDRALSKRVAARWVHLPAAERLRAIGAANAGDWRGLRPEIQDLQQWSTLQGAHGRLPTALALLRAAGLSARTVQGIRLSDEMTSTPLTWVDVWNGKNWEKLFPETGEVYRGAAVLLPLSIGGEPILKVLHGKGPELRWSVSQQIISQWRYHFERIRRSNRLLDRWSLFYLPSEFQETFRILLLVPIGALMICVLRNLAGFPTFGIFMPVLMALAFRSTGLGFGIAIFAGVVLMGYVIRSWIDRLRLLLVPRLSVILTLVILFFTGLALVGSRVGLRQFMAVGLLPFVILTMTIERFFIIAEEAGGRTAFQTAAGSTAVASITYVILHIEPLQLTFFVYPELLFAVAGLQILLGRYTGYRVSELLRFRKLGRPQ